MLLSNYKNMAKADGKNLEKLIENKFYCAKRFTEAIETLAHEKDGMSYVDAIVHFCEQNNIDVESVPKLITKPLKEKLKGEAMELNLLKISLHHSLSNLLQNGSKPGPEAPRHAAGCRTACLGTFPSAF